MNQILREIWCVIKFDQNRHLNSFDVLKRLKCCLNNPVSILYKSIAGRYRPVMVADGPITARYRFIKNASWEHNVLTMIKLLLSALFVCKHMSTLFAYICIHYLLTYV